MSPIPCEIPKASIQLAGFAIKLGPQSNGIGRMFRYGSLADIRARIRYVCFAPESGMLTTGIGPLSAKSRHQRSQDALGSGALPSLPAFARRSFATTRHQCEGVSALPLKSGYAERGHRCPQSAINVAVSLRRTSAMGQKRKRRRRSEMSALPPPSGHVQRGHRCRLSAISRNDLAIERMALAFEAKTRYKVSAIGKEDSNAR